MAKRDDPRFNASGYYDDTAYKAIKRVDQENAKERKRVYDLIGAIYRLADKAGFYVEGRVILRDKKTGKVWR